MATRREFLGAMAPGMIPGAALGFQGRLPASPDTGAFPVRNVLDFGARGDGQTLCTDGIQKAIRQAGRAGGGWVYVPPGDYRTGTLDLMDNVTLYLEAGALLRGSTDRNDYRNECLLYARNRSNFAIRGAGAIDGSGMSFWRWDPDAPRFDKPHLRGRWVIGEWRPNRMLKFVDCEGLLLEDATLRNSPGWTLHLIGCDRVNIRGLSILNGVYEEDGPNTDGIVPDACTRVRISDCYVQTGDDSIVLKIEGRETESRVCRDITVTNCVLISSETALKIGSGTRGEFRNINFSNCAIRDGGCGVGLWMYDGGLVDGWVIDNITMTLTDGGQPIYLWSYRRTDETPWGTVRNVMISNVVAEADGGVFISGVPEKPIEGVTLENIRLFMRGGREKRFHADPGYPYLRSHAGRETVWGHRHSPYDIFCRHTDNLTLRNIHFAWNSPEKPEWGSAVRCREVRDLEIDGFVGRQALGSDAPAFRLREVDGAFIRNCRAPEGTGTFLAVDEACRGITLVSNDLRRAARACERGPGADEEAVFTAANRPPS
jgi:hypothetical protein